MVVLVDRAFKRPPPYSIASVDHALRLAVVLQLEGRISVSAAAERLGVARSTAHRLLAMMVYRDFAVRDDDRVYWAGPVLELATHSRSLTSQLRSAALTHLHRLVDVLHETVNLAVRTGDTVRFVASVECERALRVGSREGMVFPAHRTTAGLLLLAELDDQDVAELYSRTGDGDGGDEPPDLAQLGKSLGRIRRSGFAVNHELSERGLVAVGVVVRMSDGTPLAGLSVSMPTVRYDPHRLPELVATLNAASQQLTSDLTPADRG